MERGRRVISPFERAAETFMLQMGLHPDVKEEFMRLAGGNVGVANALLDVIAERFSIDPPDETTPENIRAIVGAPEDPNQLDEWRSEFWEQQMNARTQAWKR